MKIGYYMIKIKNCGTVYNNLENLVDDIQIYCDEYDEKIELQKVYKVYTFKRENLQSTQIFVDKKNKELLDRLNNENERPVLEKKTITYYLVCGVDSTLTEVCKEYTTRCGALWSIIHYNIL